MVSNPPETTFGKLLKATIRQHVRSGLLAFLALSLLIIAGNAQVYGQRGAQSLQAQLYVLEVEAVQAGWTASSLRQAGQLLSELGEQRRALALFERALALEFDVQLMREIIETHLIHGNYAGALDGLKRMLSVQPDHEWAAYQAGLLLAPTDASRALAYLSRVREPGFPLVPELTALLRNQPQGQAMAVGALYAGAGRWRLAEHAFDYAADLTYPNGEALALTGLMRSIQGKSGTVWVDRALKLAPDNATIYYVQALQMRLQGDPQSSVIPLLVAITLEPENPAYYAELGQAYRELGQLDEAEYWLQVAVEISGEAPEMLSALAHFYSEEAALLPEDMFADLVELASAQADDPLVLGGYAWALHRRGQSDAALEQIDLALEAAPNTPRLLYDKARILIETEQIDAARPLLARVAETDSPYASAAARILARLG